MCSVRPPGIVEFVQPVLSIWQIVVALLVHIQLFTNRTADSVDSSYSYVNLAAVACSSPRRTRRNSAAKWIARPTGSIGGCGGHGFSDPYLRSDGVCVCETVCDPGPR